ncbi:uncharacterized protein GIQ15_06355 [Arthroderma uncinatum]|uniref:uncharacterized protein n=1 Tax=Arthroderma uncinatum TaxID=74035 RepID=UPI00144AEC96|nr:uncharacterized protein GIQ15_06355 [Arthroderma uncinatum]KAF3481008.1 hypothetical protein GIQ15_06355 [Arthroderma uncinatum]
MSLIGDHVRRLDSYVDRLQLARLSVVSQADINTEIETLESVHPPLVAAARALSGGHIRPHRVLDHLRRVHALQPAIRAVDVDTTRDGRYTASLLWLVASKATVQTFASVMASMVEETVPLSDGIWYWDEVLGSAFYSGLYTVQTAPARWARYVESIYHTIRRTNTHIRAEGEDSLMARWRTFYTLVQDGVRERSVSQAKQLILSPFQLCRTQARAKRRGLRKLREMNACAVGLLMEEGLLFDVDEDETTAAVKESPDEWQDIVSRTVLLMQTVLQHVNDLDTDLTGFEDNVFSTVERGIEAMEDSLAVEGTGHTVNPTDQAYQVVQQLIDILEYHLPHQHEQCALLSREYTRPGRLTRYWPAGLALLLSSSTILNVLTNRRAEMVTWVQELGSTITDFWTNWIIQPLARLIGTIRHDEKSEVALMSKNSLDADFASLERMVVDFVRQRPSQDLGASSHTPDALDLVRQAVRQGDLTPVLRAYERDLQRPFVGAIRGDLITALLIQIQKTKVDVEVAISGINSILKSQELVFAFIGLTPSILVSYSAVQWAAGVLGSRRGLRQGQRRGEIVRSLRTINRILTSSHDSRTGVLSYKDHGLLMCEAETLRRRAQQLLPGAIYHEFHDDLNDLLNVRAGVAQQMKVLDQIRWTYSKWISS